jgi:hypothetical protein
MIYPVVAELASEGIAVAVTCRVLGVSTSGFYEWRSRPSSPRSIADQALSHTVGEIHRMSQGIYGAPRVHAERRLAAGVRCGRKRVERTTPHPGRSRGLTITRKPSRKPGEAQPERIRLSSQSDQVAFPCQSLHRATDPHPTLDAKLSEVAHRGVRRPP